MCPPTRTQIVAATRSPSCAGEVEPDPVRLLGEQRGEHRLEVGQRPRGEVVPLGGVHVQLVEQRQVGRGAVGDLDAGLGGLLDVAAPLLVHPGQHVLLRARRAVRGAQRDLEVVLRLAGGEPALDGLRPPAELLELGHHAGPGLRALRRRQVPEPAYGVVGHALLDGGGVPAAGDHRRAHPHPERAGLPRCATIGSARPGGPPRPSRHRSLGQVGQVALDPGQLPVEHQPGADQARHRARGRTSRSTRGATRS